MEGSGAICYKDFVRNDLEVIGRERLRVWRRAVAGTEREHAAGMEPAKSAGRAGRGCNQEPWRHRGDGSERVDEARPQRTARYDLTFNSPRREPVISLPAYRFRLTTSWSISSLLVMTRLFAWKPRCETIMLVNS
jgi:hypothetical protein